MIRKLEGEQEFTKFVNIVSKAYPGVMGNSVQEKHNLKELFMAKQEHDPAIDYYGLFRDEKLIGGMRVHYYEMNLYSKMIPIGGVGLVAVDLLHKKERVAKALIDHFLQIFLQNNVHFVALYPFRPDFYKKMGFGYGPKMYQYIVEPTSFPKGQSKLNLVYVDEQLKEQVAACSRRIVEKQHGMFYKTQGELEALLKNPDNQIVAFQKEGRIQGYIVFTFKKLSESNFMLNNMVIKEWVYETPEALLELSTFINSQADQVNRVEWNTHESNTHFLLSDARNGSNHLIPSVYHASAVTGIGLMYRIIHVRAFFKDYCNRQLDSENITCKLTVQDSFLPNNNEQLIIKVIDNLMEISEDEAYDVEIKINISELSSLVMGGVTVRELYMYSRVDISDEKYVDVLNQVFNTTERPICITAF